MRRYIWEVLFLVIAIGISACSSNVSVPKQNTMETRENLFAKPSTEPKETQNEQEKIPIWGFMNNTQIESENSYINEYYIYCGEELQIDVGFRQYDDEMFVATEFGIQIFIDGEPQAFRLEGEEEYHYTQVLSREAGVSEVVSCYLMPTVGKKGDELELQVCKIPIDGANSPWFEIDYHASVAILRYEEDADAVAAERWMNVTSNATVRQEEWTHDQMMEYLTATGMSYDSQAENPSTVLYEGLHYLLYLDGEEVGRAHNYCIAGKDTIHLKMEIVGLPGTRCSYHIYWNNQLVDCVWEDAKQLVLEKGTAIILEADLDVSDLLESTSMSITLTPVNVNEVRYIPHGTEGTTSQLQFTYKLNKNESTTE